MITNDVFRRLKYALNYSTGDIKEIFNLVNVSVSEEDIIQWQKKLNQAEITDEKIMAPFELAAFLNGMIVKYRGLKDGVIPESEKELNNNIILRKIKIALNLKDVAILAYLQKADLKVGKSELSAFFRAPNHQHYRICHDQILRNFLNGLYLSNQTTKSV